MESLPTIALDMTQGADSPIRLKLPHELVMLEISDYQGIIQSHRQRLAVRGAPAIGVAAAFAVVLFDLGRRRNRIAPGFIDKVNRAILEIRQSRGPRQKVSSGRWNGCARP